MCKISKLNIWQDHQCLRSEGMVILNIIPKIRVFFPYPSNLEERKGLGKLVSSSGKAFWRHKNLTLPISTGDMNKLQRQM